MRLDHRRDKFLAGLAGAAGLLIALSVTMRPAVLYAQEDESFTVTPSVADDETEPTWEPVADVAPVAGPAMDAPDGPDGQVLELPQVVVMDHDNAAAAPADSTDPAADSAPSADQPGDLADYAAQEAVGSAFSRAMTPMLVPGAALAPVTPMEPNSPLGPNATFGASWAAPGWSRYIVVRPMGFAPFPVTSPMLTTPRGSRVMMGGWWHRAR